MCMSCGCKQPNEDHGDERNITLQDLEDAGQAGEVGTQEVVRNIQEGFQQFGQGQGQYQASGVGGRESMASSQSQGQFTGTQPQDQFSGSERQGQFTGQGTTGQQSGGQQTGNNEQDYEQ